MNTKAPPTIPWERQFTGPVHVCGYHVGCGGEVVYEELMSGGIRYCLKCGAGRRNGWAKVQENSDG